MNSTQVLHSRLDQTVNFLTPLGQESRYVRRGDDYIIVYMSSHNGCNKACRFCHLTQTGQTTMDSASRSNMVGQARMVLQHYAAEVAAGRQTAVTKLHFNWMARGEPLDNPDIVTAAKWTALVNELEALAAEFGASDIRYNISTIVPETFADSGSVLDFGTGPQPTIFYSMYSIRTGFRKRWLPKASNVWRGLRILSDWQEETGGQIVFHWPFIKGENDDTRSVENCIWAIDTFEIKGRFNLVRYNPFGPNQGEEADEEVIQRNFKMMSDGMKVPGSRIVARVGTDIKAACGMFVNVDH